MEEFKTDHRPRSFYPGHHTALPQAVANSFVEMMQLQADFVITHPEGYELNPEITTQD
jgi:N-succinyl-L-ornithine transcarbamylase